MKRNMMNYNHTLDKKNYYRDTDDIVRSIITKDIIKNLKKSCRLL